MFAVCVFGDWDFHLTDEFLAAFRPGDVTPLVWRDDGTITPALLSASPAEDIVGIALVAHWAQEHHEMLESMIGPVEVGRDLVRPRLP